MKLLNFFGEKIGSHTHPEKDLTGQTIDEEPGQVLKGPHAGVTATTTPVIAMATLYTTTYYIYSFDGKLLAEYDATGVCQKDYIYMGNKLLAEYQPVTATKYYYTSDQINSTRIITNSAGTVVYSALFDPFGGMQKQWVNTYSPSLKFSGKERESKSEMDYFGAMYYDHLKYRFISVDPVINKDEALGNPQLWNLYSYCRNNPVTYLDPNGAYEKDAHFNLTKYLASQAGFSRSDAEKLAYADQMVDDNPKTTANPGSVLKKGNKAQRLAWHFASDERVSELLTMAFASGDISELGAALHCYQDSLFAHKKYRNSASHASDSFWDKSPDNTARDVGMALEMAQGTFNILNSFWKGNKFKTIDTNFLNKVFSNWVAESRANMLSK